MQDQLTGNSFLAELFPLQISHGWIAHVKNAENSLYIAIFRAQRLSKQAAPLQE